MELDISIEIWQKKGWFIAKCPELDFISQGPSRDEAKANLLEVIQIQFEEMAEMGTLEEYLAECDYVRDDDNLVLEVEIVEFERQAIQVG